MSPRLTDESGLADAYRCRGDWTGEALPEVFAASCARWSEREVLVDAERRFTFRDIEDLVARLATGLTRLGVQPGDVVSTVLPNWWEAVVTHWAVVGLGAVFNPIVATTEDRDLSFIVREARSKVLLVPGEYRRRNHRARSERISSSAALVVVRAEPRADQVSFGDLLQERARNELAAPASTSIALLVYTSGTTANPKGVLHTHDAILYEAKSLAGAHGLDSNDATFVPSSLAHVSGLIHGAQVPFVLGTRAVLADSWHPDEAVVQIETERITYMVGAPIFLSDLVERARIRPQAFDSFRLFSCGGADVTPSLVREARTHLGCVAKRVYGSTEVPSISTTHPGDPEERGIETEGRPIGAAEIRIVDEEGQDVAAGVVGEVLARGPESFVGYRDSSLDAESFVGGNWFRTGDLGELDSEGFLRIRGRKKEIIIRKGEKLSAVEIEAAVSHHPSVSAVAVVPIPDEAVGERACACVELEEGSTIDLDVLIAFLEAEGFPARKLPEALEVFDALPRTGLGKVDKAKLRRTVARRRR